MKVISIIALLVYSVFADTIYLKNGNKIENATLTEITQTDIKYKVEGRAVVYTISKDNAEKVIYNDGSEDIFQLLEQPIVSNMLEDSRDGKTYKIVKMPDGRIWMAENLNYETSKSECYNNDKNYCDSCGRLYNWETAVNACPTGWHLPTNAEWSNLKMASGGKTAGTALKSKSNWTKDGNGRDDYGFSVLACGYRDPYIFFPSDYKNYGDGTIFWSDTKDIGIHIRYFRANDANVNNIRSPNSALYSVRCVKNDSLKTPEPLVEPFVEIGYQKIWDMHHIRLAAEILNYWFYETVGIGTRDFSYKEYNIKYLEYEIMVGYLHRWVVMQPDNIRTSLGLFGGLGFKQSFLISDKSSVCNDNDLKYCEQLYMNMRHELGAELILGYVSLYISERNFHRIGGGIGLAFWRSQ